MSSVAGVEWVIAPDHKKSQAAPPQVPPHMWLVDTERQSAQLLYISGSTTRLVSLNRARSLKVRVVRSSASPGDINAELCSHDQEPEKQAARRSTEGGVLRLQILCPLWVPHIINIKFDKYS
jgi:hypothetical protein